jgi:hypothetical protein
MPAIGRRRSERPDRDDDPQSRVRALGIISSAHRLDRLARFGFCNLGSTPLKLAAKYLELSSSIQIAGGPSQFETAIGLPAQPGHVFHGFPQFGVERAAPPSGRPRNERAIWSPRYWLFPSRIGGHEKSWPINTVPGVYVRNRTKRFGRQARCDRRSIRRARGEDQLNRPSNRSYSSRTKR